MANEEELERNQDEAEKPAAEAPVDPWAEAFAALEKRDAGDAEASEGAANGEDVKGSTTGVQVPDDGTAGGDAGLDGAADGGQADAGLATAGADGGERYTEEAAEAEVKQIEEDITQTAIREVVEACRKKGFLTNSEGQLGATIDNPAIYKKNSDGSAEFVNPDTGQPFTGDDPRKQAQDWCDQYNRELKDAFNKATAGRVQELREAQQPVIDLIKFAPTYDKLDDTRKAMFEEVISDYEVTDKKGNVIGYSCDLNRALQAVDRQIARLKTMTPPEPKAEPSGPALDMPATGAAQLSDNEVKSLEDAFNIINQRTLDSLQKGKK